MHWPIVPVFFKAQCLIPAQCPQFSKQSKVQTTRPQNNSWRTLLASSNICWMVRTAPYCIQQLIAVTWTSVSFCWPGMISWLRRNRKSILLGQKRNGSTRKIMKGSHRCTMQCSGAIRKSPSCYKNMALTSTPSTLKVLQCCILPPKEIPQCLWYMSNYNTVLLFKQGPKNRSNRQQGQYSIALGMLQWTGECL